MQLGNFEELPRFFGTGFYEIRGGFRDSDLMQLVFFKELPRFLAQVFMAQGCYTPIYVYMAGVLYSHKCTCQGCYTPIYVYMTGVIYSYICTCQGFNTPIYVNNNAKIHVLF